MRGVATRQPRQVSWRRRQVHARRFTMYPPDLPMKIEDGIAEPMGQILKSLPLKVMELTGIHACIFFRVI